MPHLRPAAAPAAPALRPRAPHLAAYLGIDEAELAVLADRLLARASFAADPPPPYHVAVREPPHYLCASPSYAAPRGLPRAVAPPTLRGPPLRADPRQPPLPSASRSQRVRALPSLAVAAALYRVHSPTDLLAGISLGVAYLVTLGALCARATRAFGPGAPAPAASDAPRTAGAQARRDAVLLAGACVAGTAQWVREGPSPGALVLLAVLWGWLGAGARTTPAPQRPVAAPDVDPAGRGRAQSPWPVVSPPMGSGRLGRLAR